MANWLDLLGANEPAAKGELIAAPSAPTVQLVWIQTRPPANGDCGMTEPAHFFVDGDTVHLCSEDGKPSGASERLTTNGSARAVAGRLRKRAWEKETGANDFNRPLGNYSRHGVA
jgi:hypothetical protein